MCYVWDGKDLGHVSRLQERRSILNFSRAMVKIWLILPPSGKNL